MENKYTKELFDNLPPKKREKVMRGIICELASSGIDGCNVRTIAKRIGLSHGSLFHYFASKDDMVHAIIQEGVRLQKEAFDRSAAPEGNFYQQLETLFHTAVNYARSNREIISIWMELSQPCQARFTRHTLEMERESIRALKKMVEEARESGLIKKEIDPAAAAYIIDSLLANLLKSVVSDIEEMKFREHFGETGGGPEKTLERILGMLRLSFTGSFS